MSNVNYVVHVMTMDKNHPPVYKFYNGETDHTFYSFEKKQLTGYKLICTIDNKGKITYPTDFKMSEESYLIMNKYTKEFLVRDYDEAIKYLAIDDYQLIGISTIKGLIPIKINIINKYFPIE